MQICIYSCERFCFVRAESVWEKWREREREKIYRTNSCDWMRKCHCKYVEIVTAWLDISDEIKYLLRGQMLKKPPIFRIESIAFYIRMRQCAPNDASEWMRLLTIICSSLSLCRFRWFCSHSHLSLALKQTYASISNTQWTRPLAGIFMQNAKLIKLSQAMLSSSLSFEALFHSCSNSLALRAVYSHTGFNNFNEMNKMLNIPKLRDFLSPMHACVDLFEMN